MSRPQWIVIARLTLLESIRKRIAIAAFVLGVLFLALYSFGFRHIYIETTAEKARSAILIQNQILNFLSTAGFYAINFLTLAMGVLVSADTLAGEISSGTIQTIASKPMKRADIVIGKWAGFCALLAIYLTFMAGGLVLLVYWISGYHVKNVVAGVLLLYLSSVLVMSLSLACSSMFSTLATGGVVFGMYGISFVGGWVEQIGAALKNDTAINIGIFSSLLIPSEAIWKRAAYEFSSSVMRSIGMAAGPFAAVSVPNPMMVAYAILYTVLMLAIAIRQFSKRDL